MNDEDFDEPPKENKKRGRPREIDKKVIFNALQKFKKKISPTEDGKLVSKTDNVWKEIAKQINNVKNEASLYTYVSCNQDNVRNVLWLDFETGNEPPDEPSDDPDGSDFVNDLLEVSTLLCNDDQCNDAFTFTIHVPAGEFDKLVETRVIYLRNKNPRNVKKFLKGDWQHFITEKIWKCTRLKCGWNFNYHHLSTDCTSGVIKGSCKCGSELNCIIERNEDGIVTINCATVSADGGAECGKRYVRGSSRAKLGDQLQGKSAHVVRAQMADAMMDEGDAEPPLLPTSPTMRVIKSQRRKEAFLHPDPIMALEVLSSLKMKDEIPWIGHKPFFVHYATKHQRTVYDKITAQEHTTLAIDATGSIVSPITRVDRTKSGPIFLYIGVLGSASKPYTVAQMLSETHTTGAIKFWLEQWIEQWGSAPPREIICDCSSALLGASVRAFTKKDTVNEYADEFLVDRDTVPSCYIRIDIAHLMKIFATLMRDVRPEVSKFYKVGIGKLVLCRNIEDAERMVRALLTVSRSRTNDKSPDGRMSACDKQKEFLRQVITTNVMEDLDLDDDFDELNKSDDIADVRSRAEPSQWRNWGNKIDASVKLNIESSPGTEPNVHWLPIFADRLIEKLKWLPLWSCVTRDRHGYGRCPASSAIVEAEFGIIKNLLLKGEDLPMRPDEFVQKHKVYVDGRSKLKESDMAVERQRCARRKTQKNKDDTPLNTLEDVNGACSDSEYDDNSKASHISSFDNGIAHSSLIEKSTTETQCPACTNGDTPEGAHHCVICKKAVHGFDLCSLPVTGSEEGYGQKRVCLSCSVKENAPKLIESRAFENWGNQIQLHEKKNLRGSRRYRKKILGKSSPVTEPLRNSESGNTSNDDPIKNPPCTPAVSSPKGRAQQKVKSSSNVKPPPKAKPKVKVNPLPKDGEEQAAGEHSQDQQSRDEAIPASQARGQYLQETYNADKFLLTDKLSSVPILKSGSGMQLKPIRKGGKKIDLANTCPFDSVFQLTLTVSFDSKPFFENTIKANAGVDPFMKMVHEVHHHKITTATYRQRADILCELFPPQGHPEIDCLVAHCETTVASMWRKLYKNLPCFEERWKCTADCALPVKSYPLLAVDFAALTSPVYPKRIEEQISLTSPEDLPRKCPINGCNGIVTTNMKISVDHLVLEVISEDEADSLKLDEIPRKLKLSFMEDEFQLGGIIHFDGWGIPRALRNADLSTEAQGHYTAFCLRNGRWYDFNRTCKPRKGTYRVSPQLVMYTRIP